MNNSDDQHILDTVKACVHSGMFVVIGVFTYVIALALTNTPHLRCNSYYRLLFHHFFSLAAFNSVGGILHSMRALRLPITRLICWILFNLQGVMGYGFTLILTLICMRISLPVLYPLRYDAVENSLYRCVISATWILALIIPVVFMVKACVLQSWHYMTALDIECPTALEDQAYIFSTFLLFLFTMLLIFYSCAFICLEGIGAGCLSQSNIKAQCTILFHVLQISLYMIPKFTVFSQGEQVIIFLLFSISQFLSLVIYGLQCKELKNEIRRFFPRCFNKCVTPEPGMSMEQRGRTGTVSSISGAVISTRTGNSTGTFHESDSVCEDYDETAV